MGGWDEEERREGRTKVIRLKCEDLVSASLPTQYHTRHVGTDPYTPMMAGGSPSSNSSSAPSESGEGQGEERGEGRGGHQSGGCITLPCSGTKHFVSDEDLCD